MARLHASQCMLVDDQIDLMLGKRQVAADVRHAMH
jgi:hypothetical protein